MPHLQTDRQPLLGLLHLFQTELEHPLSFHHLSHLHSVYFSLETHFQAQRGSLKTVQLTYTSVPHWLSP